MNFKNRIEVLTVFILILSSSFFGIERASAATCFSDWPANIFDAGYVGAAFVGASPVGTTGKDFTGGRQIVIAIAPSVSNQFQTQLDSLGKDVLVNTNYKSSNGLKIDEQLANADKPSLYGIAVQIAGPLGIAVQGVGRYFGTGAKLLAPFSFTPGARITTNVSIRTPGCDARNFTSAPVEVPNYSVPEISSSGIQADLKAVAKNFSELDNFNKLATILNSTPQNIDLYLQYQLPDVGGIIGNIGLFPDWRKCNLVSLRTSQDTSQPLFQISDPTKSTDCTIPVYGNISGELFKVANTKFQYSAPVAQPSKSSIAINPPLNKEQIIICLKDKSSLKVIGKSPKCPAGYKVKK